MQSSFDGNDNKLLIELGKANSKYNLHRNMQSSPTMATVTTQATAITINTKRGSSTQEENDSIKIRRRASFSLNRPRSTRPLFYFRLNHD